MKGSLYLILPGLSGNFILEDILWCVSPYTHLQWIFV